MILLPIEAPAVEPITVAEARAELRLDPADDYQLESRITRARVAIETWTGHRLITQRVAVHGALVVGGVAMLPIVPVQSVAAVIAVVDTAGCGCAGTVEDVLADLVSSPEGTIRGFGSGIASVSLEVVVGYGDGPASVPADFTAALLQLVGQWSEWREAVAGGLPGQGAAPPAALPYSVQELLGARRLVRAG